MSGNAVSMRLLRKPSELRYQANRLLRRGRITVIKQRLYLRLAP